MVASSFFSELKWLFNLPLVERHSGTGWQTVSPTNPLAQICIVLDKPESKAQRELVSGKQFQFRRHMHEAHREEWPS